MNQSSNKLFSGSLLLLEKKGSLFTEVKARDYYRFSACWNTYLAIGLNRDRKEFQISSKDELRRLRTPFTVPYRNFTTFLQEIKVGNVRQTCGITQVWYTIIRVQVSTKWMMSRRLSIPFQKRYTTLNAEKKTLVNYIFRNFGKKNQERVLESIKRTFFLQNRVDVKMH